jgi:uncharacterized protein (PEP-CTERM system associated)
MATVMVMVMVMAARQRHSLREGPIYSPAPLPAKAFADHFVWMAFQTVIGVFGLMPQFALAQVEAGGAPNISIVPRVSISENYSNNVFLQSSGKQNELITQISPGISINSRAGRIKGVFDYSLNELLYAKNTSARQSQNALNTAGTVEALDNWAFIDFSGNISRQAISAFGTQSNNDLAINGNSTETSVYRLSPYFRGRLGGFADYVARYSWATTRSGVATLANAQTRESSLALNGVTSGPLGWSADANSQNLTYRTGRPVADDRLKASLIYSFSPQVNVSLIGSRESNNYTTAAKESYNSAGAGLNWAISERTKLSAQLEHRSFGQSHNLSFEHRTARTAWRFSDSQDVAASPVQSGATVLGSLSDLLYGQFASIESDPFKRTQLVNQFMQNNGFNSDARVISNFLASSASLQRRQEASFALLGIRDTVSFSLTRGSNSQLSSFVTGFDDLSKSSIIRQTGVSIAYAHRLTPDAALNVVASRQNTSGAVGLQSNSLRSINLSLSGRVGRQMNASIGARRVFFESTTNPYTETGVVGNLSVLF